MSANDWNAIRQKGKTMIDESVKAKIYELEEAATKDYNDSPYLDEYLEGYRDGLHQAAKELSTAPTVDAVPVVHAHWRRYSYDEAICSHCGYDRWTDFECSKEADEKWDELPPYCEECGARMDGADGERKEG